MIYVTIQKYNSLKKLSYTVLCLVIGTIVCIGCKEDSGLIGLGVQPDEEFLNTDYFDTTTIIAYSALHDSLITSTVSTNMLGDIHDLVFGNTKAGIYTQFRLSATSVDFGQSPGVDSLVLTLVYTGSFGDTNNSFSLKVYELTGDLERKSYYAQSSINHDNNTLTEDPNLYISPTPTTKQDSSASSYYLRVQLKKSFANDKFITKSNSGEYANDAAFLNYFKGLYLEADNKTGDGCIVSLDMTHSLSGLTLYYHNDQASNLKYTFKLNDSTVHFGAINHDYTGITNSLREQLDGNYTNTSEELYAQSGSGIKVVLNFPHLKEMFKDKKVVIHRAMLVVSHKDDALRNYSHPSSLTLTYTNPATGTGYVLPDYVLGLGNDYFGGKYNTATKEYRFNITQYIQDLIDGDGDNYSLNLLNPSASYLSRLMIYGTHPASASDLDKRLHLKINYTIIDK
jgi:hypothetical protein